MRNIKIGDTYRVVCEDGLPTGKGIITVGDSFTIDYVDADGWGWVKCNCVVTPSNIHSGDVELVDSTFEEKPSYLPSTKYHLTSESLPAECVNCWVKTAYDYITIAVYEYGAWWDSFGDEDATAIENVKWWCLTEVETFEGCE